MLVFKNRTPTLEEVRDFFYQTDSVFDVPVSLRVNIDDYTLKLFNYSRFYTCYNEEEIVGMICCYINQPPTAFISHVCVRSEFHQLGIFSKLLEMLKADCARNGITQIKLEVLVDNIRASKVYEKKGFKVYEKKTSSYIMVKNIE